MLRDTMEDLICPHCGVSQRIDPTLKNAFCNFCGSSLTEVLQDLLKDQKPDVLLKTGNISDQNHQISNDSQNTHLPFSENQQIPSLPRVSNNQNIPFKTSTENSSSPFISGTSSKPIPPQQEKALLEFLQLNKNIPIPTGLPSYYFGRNMIIPLVNPNKFDIEWLNSISRVRKESNGNIKYHFVIHKAQDGSYYIEDNQSRWGTWVNRQQIKGKGRVKLSNGDRIELMLSKPNIKQIFPFVITFRLS